MLAAWSTLSVTSSHSLNGAQLRMSRHRLWVDTSKSHRELGLAAPKSFSLAAQAAYDWYRSAGMI
jgi:hypothetical protein